MVITSSTPEGYGHEYGMRIGNLTPPPAKRPEQTDWALP
jgi:hypothetical protein